MAGSANNEDDGMVSGINVTPFVDICLVLLIIFMVTARFIDQKAMPMDLPKAANGQEVQLHFAVSLHANGQTTIDGHQVAGDEAILAAAKEAQSKNADLRATVKADASVPHGRFVHAIDLLKQAGVFKIAIGVETGVAASGAPQAPPAPPVPVGTAP